MIGWPICVMVALYFLIGECNLHWAFIRFYANWLGDEAVVKLRSLKKVGQDHDEKRRDEEEEGEVVEEEEGEVKEEATQNKGAGAEGEAVGGEALSPQLKDDEQTSAMEVVYAAGAVDEGKKRVMKSEFLSALSKGSEDAQLHDLLDRSLTFVDRGINFVEKCREEELAAKKEERKARDEERQVRAQCGTSSRRKVRSMVACPLLPHTCFPCVYTVP